jgi:cytoskeletal protein CcmA (bactofilin family)
MGKSESRLDTVIGPETSVRGDVRVGGSIRLDGKLEGQLDVTEAFMTGPKSLLKGEVHCRDAIVGGRVEGNIVATETVELQTGAQVLGDVSCRGLVIQRECVFQGNCSMGLEPGQAEKTEHQGG